ncbi:hypothetical protein PR202_gb18040 [Eleusine coracana subsp. coracana]|uniref:Nucleolar protein 10-like N-terminal domain-containing protein n=1 Tax=Eleusine coracana subsp. coracana TaxID=191504 RepID=A0AAV5F4M3_ELECO|nr:hypothetical protein PR202_gb18040 [Eleusine coracana subsp. coracana]
MRKKSSVGRINIPALSSEDYNQEVTSLRFDEDQGYLIAVGSSTGKSMASVSIYDLRMSSPLRVKDHMYGSPILNIKWHQTLNSTEPKLITADKHIVRVWDPNTGNNMTSIEPDGGAINDVCIFQNSGLMLLALDNSQIPAHFIPALGPAPKWCSHLDNLTQRAEVAPVEYETLKEEIKKKKIEEQRKSRITQVVKIPKVNRNFTKDLVEEEMDPDMENADKASMKKRKKRLELSKAVYNDERFKEMFTNESTSGGWILIHDLRFETATTKINVTPDEQYVIASDLLGDDYSKLAFLCADRSENLHAKYGSHYSLNVKEVTSLRFDEDQGYLIFGSEQQQKYQFMIYACLLLCELGSHGNNMTSIEPDGGAINDVCIFQNSGLMLLALDNSQIPAHFIPALGPAPKWCSHLDNLSQRAEVAPVEYETLKEEIKKKKIEEQRKSRITQVVKIPKVNRNFTKDLVEEEMDPDMENADKATSMKEPRLEEHFDSVSEDDQHTDGSVSDASAKSDSDDDVPNSRRIRLYEVKDDRHAEAFLNSVSLAHEDAQPIEERVAALDRQHNSNTLGKVKYGPGGSREISFFTKSSRSHREEAPNDEEPKDFKRRGVQSLGLKQGKAEYYMFGGNRGRGRGGRGRGGRGGRGRGRR